MSYRRHMPICQHILLGLELLHTRDTLISRLQQLQGIYPKTSPVAVKAKKALDDLDRLRAELDNQSAAEHPGPDEWAPHIYYGSNVCTWREMVLPIWRRHQAAGPDCCAGVQEPVR